MKPAATSRALTASSKTGETANSWLAATVAPGGTEDAVLPGTESPNIGRDCVHYLSMERVPRSLEGTARLSARRQDAGADQAITHKSLLGFDNDAAEQYKNQLANDVVPLSPTEEVSGSTAETASLSLNLPHPLNRSEAAQDLIQAHQLSPSAFQSPYLALRRTCEKARQTGGPASPEQQETLRKHYALQQVEASAKAISKLEEKGAARPRIRCDTSPAYSEIDGQSRPSNTHGPVSDPDFAFALHIPSERPNDHRHCASTPREDNRIHPSSVQDRRIAKYTEKANIAALATAQRSSPKQLMAVETAPKASAKRGLYVSHEIYHNSQHTRPVAEILREVVDVRYPIAGEDETVAEREAGEGDSLFVHAGSVRARRWWRQWWWWWW